MSTLAKPTRRHVRRQWLGAGGALALTGLTGPLLPSPSHAQSDWPSRPVRLIVPFPAGGGADLAARSLGIQLGGLFGKPVVIENRAGADGTVAALEVIKAPADGHTLFFATASSLSYVPALKRNPPYDPIGDFTPISSLCVFTFYLMAAPSLGVRNLAELVAHVKANPGKVAYASGNSTGILAMGQLAHANRLDMTHVPYKGEAQAVIDLVGGRVPLMWATPAIMPQLSKEKFVPLAVLMPRRTTALPEVPTIAETGQALVNISPWGGLFGPAKMPVDLVERIARDVGTALRKTEIVDQYEKLGLLPQPSSPHALADLVKDQLNVFSRTLRSLGVPQE
jgi:tripartite-type tricarboxylate transporter receptor subunit TctC